ncbi:hypothetical protein, partial [Aeromonas veronii]|uniref:hypothetical protein n=1 Tax=Aeromonas veronii TaxID=654 RepID=UPI003EC6AC68
LSLDMIGYVEFGHSVSNCFVAVVRSATNLKAFPDGKAFLLWFFFPVTSRFAHQNERQSPVSRPGFDVFSLLLSCRHPTTMAIPSPVGDLATVSTSVSQHIPSWPYCSAAS